MFKKNKENLIDVLEGRIKKQDEVLTSLLKQRLSPGKGRASDNGMNPLTSGADMQAPFSPHADDQSRWAMNKMKPVKYVPSAENNNFFRQIFTNYKIEINPISLLFNNEKNDLVE